MIYFIGNKEFDVCKIGYSTKENVEARIRGLQTSCPYPLEVINTREGTTKQESKLHNHFKADKLNGEWFKLSKINPFISFADIVELPIPKRVIITRNAGKYKVTGNLVNINIDTDVHKEAQEYCKRISKESGKYLSFSKLCAIVLETELKKR